MERLAIIGGGISGLTCAFKLQDRFDITLYERDARLGGHARTFVTPAGHRINPDVMLFVRGAFTSFFRLMDEIGFDRFRRASLSTVIHENGRVLHADLPPDLRTLRRNFLHYLDPRGAPSFFHWARYFAFMLRFQRDWSRGRFSPDERVEALARYYPEHEAVVNGWAVPFSQIKGNVTISINDLAYLLFGNIYLGALLRGDVSLVMPEDGVAGYVDRLVARTAASFETSTGIRRLARAGGRFLIETEHGVSRAFDRVIVAACPADLHRFVDPWEPALAALSTRMDDLYERSLSVIHADPGVMKGIPKRFWGTGAFNYDPARQDNTVTLYAPGFYGFDEELFVTYLRPYGMEIRRGEIPPAAEWAKLPPACRIDPARVLDVAVHQHPRWGSVAQRDRFRRLHEYRGTPGLYFCGVGLDGKNTLGHEGAVASAYGVAARIRAEALATPVSESPARGAGASMGGAL